ncbi:DUF3159 domain-containing protein [Halanaerobium hydrogeniformans]|uniref:DUF3159 domain-containing protein n=1 Tax=Halanaerobium hydrogeniformans TaxID=656519 RepID=E4RK56_HALHG|nr:DUF3159 domain-containing protein [Halanaerobium hydrogeniformans]ADQ14608.1 hypothetical protein Halsa_1177 [Halanaerobium hydrogeniformans]
MKINAQEILSELKSIVFSRTFDAILPPLVFAIINNFFTLNYALIFAVFTALAIIFKRIIKKENWKYSFVGLFIVIFASALAFLTDNASSYFLPAIFSSSLLLIITIISLILGKPIAALASHISRSWPLEWFWRKDIKPAYREVSIFWAIFIAFRLSIQILLFQSASPLFLAWSNILLGWPFTITILIISYIYGLWRLKNLGGPGVEEFKNNKKPPWEGQKKGF